MEANRIELLLIEDNPGDARLIREALREKDSDLFDLQQADRLATGLARLVEGDIHLVLLDLSLPDSHGLDTVARTHAQAPDVPILVLTGLDDEALALQALEMGAQDYLVKGDADGRTLRRAIRYAIERQRAEQALRQSEARYRGLFDYSLNGFALHQIVTDADGQPVDYTFLEVNPAFERLTGLRAEAIIGKRATEVLPGIEKDPFIAIYGQVALTGQPVQFEQYATPLKKHFDIVAFSPRRGQFAAAFTDITERKRAEDRLKESENKYRHLFHQANDVMVIIEPEQEIILEANAKACATYGYEHDELVGLSLKAFSRDAETGQTHIQDFLDGRPQSNFESVHINRNGEEFHFLINCALIDYNGKKAILSINRDITERQRAEEALRVSQQIIEGIFNSTPVRIFWKDKNLVYLGCNAIFAHDAGFANPKDIVGKDDYQMGWRDQAKLYQGDDRQVIESGRPKLLIEEPSTTPEGNIITLLTSKVPLRSSNGEVIGILGTYMDITERKRAEEEIKKQLEELQRWNNATLGRENRIIELKREVNDLLGKDSQPPRYPSVE